MGEFRYGDDKTIHATSEVNVERDEVTGEVVAVWFRCAMLPFTDITVGPHRTESMKEHYKSSSTPKKIKAIVFESHPNDK